MILQRDLNIPDLQSYFEDEDVDREDKFDKEFREFKVHLGSSRGHQGSSWVHYCSSWFIRVQGSGVLHSSYK